MPLPDARGPSGSTAPALTGRARSNSGSWGNGLVSAPPALGSNKPPPARDPKSRARSRDYLKQYVSDS